MESKRPDDMLLNNGSDNAEKAARLNDPPDFVMQAPPLHTDAQSGMGGGRGVRQNYYAENSYSSGESDFNELQQSSRKNSEEEQPPENDENDRDNDMPPAQDTYTDKEAAAMSDISRDGETDDIGMPVQVPDIGIQPSGKKRRKQAQEEEETEVTEEEYQQYLADRREQIKHVKSRNRHRRTFFHILAGVLLSVFIISVSSFFAVYIVKSVLDFLVICKVYCEAEVVIENGDTVDDIAMKLANLGIISMPDVFKAYTRFSDAENDFINGTFTVDTTMSYSALLLSLQTVSTINKTVDITIKEGMRIDEIAQLLEENLVCRAKDFMEQCKILDDTYKFQKRLEYEKLKYYQMEGYIFPDTYKFYIIPALEDNNELDTTEYAQDVLDAIYKNFNEKITAKYYNRMSALGLTLDETITLASMVQREADSAKNMRVVASVFFNRLDYPDGFPHLESDVTVHYVDEQIKPHLTSLEIRTSQDMFDAYDTYVCDGIPVGPICNPGLDAIKAVLYAPDSTYYYFCAHPETTEMYFAETISEHEVNLAICGLEHAIAD